MLLVTDEKKGKPMAGIKTYLSGVTMALVLTACDTMDGGSAPVEPLVSTAVDGWDYTMPAAELADLCSNALAQAKAQFAAIESDTGPASLESVYGPYDDMGRTLQTIQHVWHMKSVHPEADVRDAATQCAEDYSDFASGIGLSRDFYNRVAAINTDGLSPAEQLMVANQIRDFRQAGVDKDEATRDAVRALRKEITEIGNRFDQTIREDTRYVEARLDQLAGLPQDYIDARPPNAEGMIRISTDYPDYFPVMRYGHDDALRQALSVARLSIGTPDNSQTLQQLIEKRHELAQLLGYESYAAYAMDGLMIETPERARSFLDEVGVALKQAAEKDLGILLTRLRQIDPTAEEIQVWQGSYLSNLVREEEYSLDSKEVRQYFHFDKVQQGIFELTETLFGVQIVPWQTGVWHPDVTAWEVRENGEPIGRFYLDMHPRENKYKHAAHWTLRSGLADEQVPLSGLATNFPKGLMEHNQVETYLHEFGHLLHNMFSGTQTWFDITGMSMERDFVEAPSQMLEEWIWDLDTLQSFATNEAGEPIPAALVEKMNRARYFTTAMNTAQQIFYANISLAFYSTDPAELNLLESLQSLQAKYSPYPYADGTYFYNNFGHLNGYSSNYYIYQWSLAIATDLFSRFEAEGMTNTQVAKQYRDTILGAAGSRPAAEFVEDFLGRPFSTQAYIDLLSNL